jgi:hypothetical protein
MSRDTTSLANPAIKEAADMLAKRAAVARLLRKAEKKADYNDSLKNGLSVLQRQISLHPAIASTLGGAALGAGVGGLSSMATDDDRRNTGGSMLTGALAGGALGGGAYMGSRMLPQIQQKLQTNPNVFSFNHGGEQRKLDPKAVANSPELVKEVEQLKQRSLPTRLVGGSYDFVKDYAKNNPIIATILGLDVGSNVLGTTANAVNPTPSMRNMDLREGLLRHLPQAGKDKPSPIGETKSLDDVLGWISSQGDSVKNKVLATARGLGDDESLDTEGFGYKRPSDRQGNPTGPSKVPVSKLREITDLGGGKIRPGGVRSAKDIYDYILNLGSKSDQTPTFGPHGPEAANKRLWGTGYDFDPATGMAKELPDPKWKVPGLNKEVTLPVNSGLRAFEHGPTPTRFLRQNAWSRLGPRAALYAGVPLLQEYANIAGQESANNKRLEQLIQQMSQPVGN